MYPSESEVDRWYQALDWTTKLTDGEMQKACQAAYGEYKVAIDQLEEIVRTLNEYRSTSSQLTRLEALKA